MLVVGELGDGRLGVDVDSSEDDVDVSDIFGFRGDDFGLSANRFGIGGGVVGGSDACETVVKFAAHGRRKVGGNGHLESSSALLRLRESILR